jgi:hypothetical protein
MFEGAVGSIVLRAAARICVSSASRKENQHNLDNSETARVLWFFKLYFKRERVVENVIIC